VSEVGLGKMLVRLNWLKIVTNAAALKVYCSSSNSDIRTVQQH